MPSVKNEVVKFIKEHVGMYTRKEIAKLTRETYTDVCFTISAFKLGYMIKVAKCSHPSPSVTNGGILHVRGSGRKKDIRLPTYAVNNFPNVTEFQWEYKKDASGKEFLIITPVMADIKQVSLKS